MASLFDSVLSGRGRARQAVFALSIIFFLSSLSLHAMAASLTVEKVLPGDYVYTGEDVTIRLRVMNPFGMEVPVRIVDDNVFGSNGLEIQCLEYTIPADKGVELSYEPIKPYSPGNYTLGAAQVTYTNPETGIEETVESTQVNISVVGAAQGQASGITQIYRCNGVSMQSTSYSSSGQSQGQQQNEQQQEEQSEQQKEDEAQKKVQNNQMNQNTQALQKEISEQKQTEEEFKKNVDSNEEFREKEQQLLDEGYQRKEETQNPSSNDSGSFERKYEKPTGEQASLDGEMQDGEMKSLGEERQDSQEKMMQALSEDPRFQDANKSLNDAGFDRSQSAPEFKSLGNNKTEIRITYNDSLGNQKNVTATYAEGNITKVEVDDEREEEKKDHTLWMLALIALALLVLFLYKKYGKKNLARTEFEVEKEERPVDYRRTALDMLAEAEKLFGEGREKDAYEKVSQAVRYYYSMKLDVKKELTSTELYSILRSREMDAGLARKCLNLCGMVEFARYKTNKEDYSEIMGCARDIIA